MLPPHHEALDEKLLRGLLDSSDEALRLEAVRTLSLSPIAAAPAILRDFAFNDANTTTLRAEAIAGLAAAMAAPARKPDVRTALIGLLESTDHDLRLEAIRALASATAADDEAASSLRMRATALVSHGPAKGGRDSLIADEAELLAIALAATGSVPAELDALRPQRPADMDEWTAAVGEAGDAERGRRVFFHAGGAVCQRCHRIDGRGGNIGPNLSVIARSADRRKLAESILDPSREIAPQFATWSFVLRSGKVENGVILSEDRSGMVRIGTAEGVIVEIPGAEIESRVAQKTSLMPDKLVDRMTIAELRDVLAYLETLR
jgi:putative heme-binding domain-containing protein